MWYGWMDVICPLSEDPWLVFSNPQAADSGALIMAEEESTTMKHARVRNRMAEVDDFLSRQLM